MSNLPGIPIWRKNPFIRLLFPFITGIVLQWYIQFSLPVILAALISFSISFYLFFLLPLFLRFRLQAVQGISLHLMIAAFGSLITWQKDIRREADWYGHFYKEDDVLLVRIDEPLIEKTRSYKAEGYVEGLVQNNRIIPCEGKLLLYFSKDNLPNRLEYGDRILIHRQLQTIKNSGNPGAFNYQRYAAFQQLFHNVFLKAGDWIKIGAMNQARGFPQFIFNTREYVLSVLRDKLRGTKDELGIAEALLIGYTNDLDKDLVQAYSNTGVVHIIAISGMHLGLIYILLLWLFARIPMIKRSKWVQAVLVLVCLWIFSLLTGGSASVIRSAVMFTFITVGRTIFARQSSLFASLSASAFVMLCFNPYYLWDVGFQLSYLAVVGIVVFQRPVYNIIYIKNKWLDKVWQLAAVSLAAQILTFPVCIYYFHQFPNLFLATNIIAVPLSALILYAEIGLILLAWIPMIGDMTGKFVAWLVWLMNKIILWADQLPFAVWDNIPSTVPSTWLLYGIVISFSTWLMTKSKTRFKTGLIFLLFFSAVITHDKWRSATQQKFIVYNVSRYQGIDFIDGNNYYFAGDSILLQDGLLQNFHLKPGRISMHLFNRKDSLPSLFRKGSFYQFYDRRIVVIDQTFHIGETGQAPAADLVVLSKNPAVDITKLQKLFNARQYILDASNLSWKTAKWEHECRQMSIPVHNVASQGAFIIDIGM